MPQIMLGQSLFLIMWGAWCKGGFLSQEMWYTFIKFLWFYLSKWIYSVVASFYFSAAAKSEEKLMW